MKYKLKRVPYEETPILSAQVCDNDQMFADIAKLYFHDGWTIADMTYGRGVFWKQTDTNQFNVLQSDIEYDRSIHLQANAIDLPFATNSLDALIFDPPYLLVGGLKTLKKSIDRGYRNANRGFAGRHAVRDMYFTFLDGAQRAVKLGGLVITKSMMQVESGGVRPQTTEILYYAQDNGYKLVDWLVVVAKSTPTMRHPYQMHSRRNCSDFLVLANEATK